jgi:hypothetical protein
MKQPKNIRVLVQTEWGLRITTFSRLDWLRMQTATASCNWLTYTSCAIPLLYLLAMARIDGIIILDTHG